MPINILTHTLFFQKLPSPAPAPVSASESKNTPVVGPCDTGTL